MLQHIRSLPDVCVSVGVEASLTIISRIIAICLRSEMGTRGVGDPVLNLDMSAGSKRNWDFLQTVVFHLSVKKVDTQGIAVAGNCEMRGCFSY